MPRTVTTGETMHARWASIGSHARVVDELFVVARGPSAALALDALASLAGAADPTSRSALRSPPADPLAALLQLVDLRLADHGAVAIAALRLTPPWATVALAGDVYVAHAAEHVTRIGGTAPPLGAGGSLAVTYLPLARGFVLATAEVDPTRATDRAAPIEDRCRGLAIGDDEAAIVIELL